MHSQDTQGYSLVNQDSAALQALAKRAKLERVRDAAFDMLNDMPQNPTTSETRKFLTEEAAKATRGIEDLNRTFGLTRPHLVSAPLS